MNRTITQAKKNPGQFDDRTGAFRTTKHAGFSNKECILQGRARQAFTLLLRAGTQGVTQAQALIAGNGWRLAASIHVLRAKGFRIRTHREYRPNGSWCARYELMGLVEGAQQ